ncbi:deoxyribose-phosphate aldolase [Aliidiomarina minuta]|uniref:Deoxyribose-phosphate aldolase n=1 Tax=Aliidiomarina minuta TaxID=880057 RepID=A0A432WA39_9GAMM|nr:deoxyribose-phosphate aldolase [Aliidiomarina minuta]RUO26846.1 deoxyribose-phosphate aldolase [Aliidiomarina minuta]
MSHVSAEQQALAAKAISLLDLTSLNDDDNQHSIRTLCEQAVVTDTQGTPHSVAALCIYPRFVPFARQQLDQLGFYQVRLATVANFPHGQSDIDIAVKETRACIAYGADEVDLVFPYQAFLDGEEKVAASLIAACKSECNNKAQLKVILETGELKSSTAITKASELAILAGADFIKTSTGKVAVNATPQSAELMLQAIAAQPRAVGFKPAGGIKNLDDVQTYFKLVTDTVGEERLTPGYFRFGASSLLTSLKNILQGSDTQPDSEGY